MSRTSFVSVIALAAGLVAALPAVASAQDSAAAVPGAASQTPSEASPAPDIIVTGTRASGITAAESAAPIKLLSSDAISHVGQPNLNQVLTQLVPSFTAQSYGGDTANLTLSAALRGLSPNQTLVLVNGKRRHGTSNFQVRAGLFQGGAAPDLDMISPLSIKRVEVLEDGASAQYGSDAIAGVINIILKDQDHGGSVTGTAGQYYRGDGLQYSASANVGLKLGDNGFLDLTGFYRRHEHSVIGGIDNRVSNPDGSIATVTGASGSKLTAAQQSAYQAIPGYPYINRLFGDAESKLATVDFNAGYDLGAAQLYSFGSYGHRDAQSYESFRLPDTTIASPVLGVKGSFTTPGELIFAPLGYQPSVATNEDDFALTAGVKGGAGGWHWDISSTYGADKSRISTINSANTSLYVDTHATPTTFYDGFFQATELTLNADVTRAFDMGMATPLTLAFGGEYRHNGFSIGSGDAASIYKEGGQSYPGFLPTDAGTHRRDNEAGYIDVALSLIEKLKLDGAARIEHYSDFGTKVTEKITGRYDFSPAFAIRGTAATGFRAPSLLEEYYSATNVATTSATVQLPPNSSAAKLLGVPDLKPERSTNFSVGTVIRPTSRLTITVDAYQIKIDDRIVSTGNIFGRGGVVNSPAVIAAIAAHGNVLDPTVTSVGVATFTNGLDTRSRGVDATASLLTPLGSLGRATWTLSGNYNNISITRVDPTPAQLSGQTLFSPTAIFSLENSSPHVKVIGGVQWDLGNFAATVRETFYGAVSQLNSPNNGNYVLNRIGNTAITDLEISYKFARRFSIALGSQNLFNRKPPAVLIDPVTGRISTGQNVYGAPLVFSPYGINGGYYYARIGVSW